MIRSLIFALALAVLPAAGLDLSKLKPQGYVSDFAHVVDARGKAELERYAALVKERTGVEMAFVTIDTLDDEPIEDVANKLYEQWGIGAKATNEGTLLLLAIKDRRSRLEVGYGLEPNLPDGFAGQVLRDMRPALRDGAYGDAFIAAANTIADRVAKAKGVTLDGQLQPSRQRQRPSPGIPIGLIIVAVIVVILIVSASANNNRPGGPRMGGIPPIILGGLPRPRSGGGFGGFDSGGGGGFGGFGGGSSGGGGASSNW